MEQLHLLHPSHVHAPSSAASATQPTGSLFMCSALYLAACKGRTRQVVALLQRDGGAAAAAQTIGGQHGRCDVHEVTAARNTALHIAAEQGHTELVWELCSRDRSLLSSRNLALDTPLHCAASSGLGEAVPLIVQLAQDFQEVNGILGGKNEAGDTALHVAARHGQGRAVEALMSVSPGLSSELNNAGVSPLYLAVMSRSARAVRAIIRSRDASAAGPSSQNALHAAVFQSSEMVSLLLQWRPALAGEVDDARSSPLHFASSDGDRSIVRAILRAALPSTVSLQDSEGLSAVHVAALMGHAGVVEELLKTCPEAAELRDSRRGTFLHAAAKEGRTLVVSRALKAEHMRCSLLNAQDIDGNTPLHLAVVAGDAGIAQRLLSSGKVRADAMNNDGHTPFDLAENLTSFFPMARLVEVLCVSGVQFRPRRQDHVKKWSGGGGVAPWSETASDSLVVVAVLIATVAFSAAFNVPGSYGDDGTAHLKEVRLYRFFLYLDTVAMVSSVIAVALLVIAKLSRSTAPQKVIVFSLHCILVSLLSMVLAFYAAVVAVTGKANTVLLDVVVYYGIFILSLKMTSVDKAAQFTGSLRFLWRSCCLARRQHTTRRIGRQHPLVVYYARNLFIFCAILLAALCLLPIINYGQPPHRTSAAGTPPPLAAPPLPF